MSHAFDRYMPFFGADFYESENVLCMSLAGQAVYLKALWYQWRHGSLPADQQRLARVLGVTSDQMAELWPELQPCFEVVEDRLANARCAVERERVLAASEAASKAGKSSAAKRLGTTTPPSETTAETSTDTAVERAVNARSTPVESPLQRPLNGRSTPVQPEEKRRGEYSPPPPPSGGRSRKRFKEETDPETCRCNNCPACLKRYASHVASGKRTVRNYGAGSAMVEPPVVQLEPEVD
jgi:uncharacterized protein YdaU (DUF1376 family)